MYSAYFVKKNGQKFSFGYENGILFDISPLAELDVDIGSNQGFGQIGETVQTQGLAGVTRTISGKIIDNSKKSQLISIFSPFSEGKLVFENKWYCDCVVKKSPEIQVSGIQVNFSLMLFCPSPYWKSMQESYFSIGVIDPQFQYPCTLNTHKFGAKNENAFVNALNKGEKTNDFTISFFASLPVENYGITNVITGEFISLSDTLQAGEEVNIYRENGILRVKKTSGDTVSDIFSKLDEDSNMFYLQNGDNLLTMSADSGLEYLSCAISFYTAKSGVYDGM